MRLLKRLFHPLIFAPLTSTYLALFLLPASVWFDPRAVVVDGNHDAR